MQMFKLDVDCISPIYPHHILTPWLYPKIFKCQKVQAPSSISGSPSKEFENVRNKWNSGLSLRKGGCKCCRVGKESFLSVHRNVTCYVLLSCSHTICIFFLGGYTSYTDFQQVSPHVWGDFSGNHVLMFCHRVVDSVSPSFWWASRIIIINVAIENHHFYSVNQCNSYNVYQ